MLTAWAAVSASDSAAETQRPQLVHHHSRFPIRRPKPIGRQGENPEAPLFQPGGRGAAATCSGGHGDTVGTRLSRCHCRGRAGEE